MCSLRIGGLASGMDIDQIVKDLMRVERMPLDKLKQKKQAMEWQRDDYRSMNTLLLNFRSELTQMKLTTKYRARTTSSTNESYVTATASSAASQSSYSISKVTQLASTERMLNGGKLSLNAGNSLYEQTKGSSDITWNAGSIESKTLSSDGTKNVYSLDVPVENLKDFSSWSVKVNGRGYKVVNEEAFNDSSADKNVVWIDETTGELHFKENVAKDSSIRIDYIADKKTDTLSLSHNTSSLQLSKKSIRDVFNVEGTSSQIKLLKSVKEGEGEPSESEVFFDLDSEGNILDSDQTVIGILDKSTGKITFTLSNEELQEKGYLPPEEPKEGITYDYKLEITYNQNYTNFAIDTVTSDGKMHESFLVAGNDNINSLTSRINASKTGATLFYDEVSGRMSLSRTETGKFNAESDGKDISVQGDLFNNMFKFADGTTDLGKNAMFVINGIETHRSSNTFSMNGVTFTLKQIFGEGKDNSNVPPVSINVNNDSTQVFDNIVEFVNKYNELIEKIREKTQEEVYRNYQPLTDAEREELTDKQQEQWEEKARSGLLSRDPILTSVLSDMRGNFYRPVENDDVSSLYNQLSELGITTSSSYLEGGKLIIDEAKLKEAIENDPTSVENFFRSDGITEGQKGVISRLYDSVTTAMDKLREKAGGSLSTNQTFTIGRQLDSIDDSIDRFEDRLVQIEDRYWRQFTAMEKAIQQANSQMNYLWQQFSGQ